MSHDHSFTATQMHWQPELIRLTQISHPDMDAGEATPCYLNPQYILTINRLMSSFSKESSSEQDPKQREYHQRVACTHVMTVYGYGLMVLESPETVASLRDRALGYEKKPKPV